MAVNLEKIDLLMERANISYKEAKEALELHDGDMVEALIYLESSNKTTQNVKQRYARAQKDHQAHADKAKKVFDKLQQTRFVIRKKDHRIVDLPLFIAIILVLVALPVSLFILLLPYFFGYKISLFGPDGKKMSPEEAFDFSETFGKSEETSNGERY
ncbi:MAG: hypothetical protein PWQ12_2155 [Clostridiales bacterium]|jgi:hypothetical protein|nr:hypothetical protein [Clostridiales bacterium]